VVEFETLRRESERLRRRSKRLIGTIDQLRRRLAQLYIDAAPVDHRSAGLRSPAPRARLNSLRDVETTAPGARDRSHDR
jgi:hypothetical protein